MVPSGYHHRQAQDYTLVLEINYQMMFILKSEGFPIKALRYSSLRLITTNAGTYSSKTVGDISSVFPSLSGIESPPLPQRFANLKKDLIRGNEKEVEESWHRLLADLRNENEIIKNSGSGVIPEIAFNALGDIAKRTSFRDALHKRGVAVIRGVVSEQEALDWKDLLQRYIRTNPSTKGG